MNKVISFPQSDEYPSYIEEYLKWVKKDGSLLQQFEDALVASSKLISSLSEKQLNHRYKTNKWSVKELLVHIIDDERIYAYRALTFARNDKTVLPGFEEKDYVTFSNVEKRPMQNILDEYIAVRKSTIALFDSFTEEALLRKGNANNNTSTVRALGYHILGHELHHVNMIKNTYLKSN